MNYDKIESDKQGYVNILTRSVKVRNDISTSMDTHLTENNGDLRRRVEEIFYPCGVNELYKNHEENEIKKALSLAEITFKGINTNKTEKQQIVYEFIDALANMSYEEAKLYLAQEKKTPEEILTISKDPDREDITDYSSYLISNDTQPYEKGKFNTILSQMMNQDKK